ncbi:MAG: Flp family type IVb pilin [Hyphomicrobiaceae bacterium]
MLDFHRDDRSRAAEGWRGLFADFMRSEKAAASIEYGLIAAIVCIGIVASLMTITPELVGIFDSVTTWFEAILGA